jgi:dTDP-4-dehydrorhamnose 3,5-epimerase
MIFRPLDVSGAFLIDPEPIPDERGFFARLWCQREFEERGLLGRIVQCSQSFNTRKGTLRGLHYQLAPHAEVKIVRCTRGALYDVILDLRPASPTFKKHAAVTLTAENRCMAYVPEGCAHGFETLEDGTEVFYLISEFFRPDHARGVRWNDSAFAIPWPPGEKTLNERDRTYPDFSP